MKPQITDLLFQ